MRRERVAERGGVKPQCLRPYCRKCGSGHRISAREQGDIVAKRNQLLGQERNDPFGTSIELWWHRFI
jgi:hypothetical protein